jgi:CheY-like chemotaxis protein
MEASYNNGKHAYFYEDSAVEGTLNAKGRQSSAHSPTEKHENRGHILVVDDERCIRDTLVMLFRSMGFDVKAAESGGEALLFFIRGSYDMVFTDLQMPGMDGWTLASHVKSVSPNTPVILLTAEEETIIRKKLGKSSVDQVLFKPFDIADMQETIRMFEKESKERAQREGPFMRTETRDRRRNTVDRRSGSDRRRAYKLGYITREGGVERRGTRDRRDCLDRRWDWMMSAEDHCSSVYVGDSRASHG